jgi:3-oxoacyl-[acyl-carrier-protein] synthase-1
MRALNEAGIEPKDIDYVNAHATSTPQGDYQEAKALARFFAEHKTLVSSTKSMTGHECWMAGASEAIYSILMMKNSFVAPNINYTEGDEYSKLLNITPVTVDKKLNIVLSNSFGFGGTNSALIIKNI